MIQSRFFTRLGNFNKITQKTSVTFVADLTCDFAKRLLIAKAKVNGLFRKTHTWILFGNSLEDLAKQNYAFSFYSNIYFVNDTNPNFKITKIYKHSESSKNLWEKSWGSWSATKMTFLRSSAEDRTDFYGDPIRVSYAMTFQESSFHLTDYRQPDKDIIPKMIYLSMSNVAYFLNATHVPIFRKFWGEFDPKTELYTPGGMFADLHQGYSDVAGNVALITHERLINFRFLAAQASPNMVSWFFRAPRLMSTKNIWLLPFNSLTWCVVGAVHIIGGIIFYIIVITEDRYQLSQDASCPKHDEFKYVIFDMATHFFTQKGKSREFGSWSGKIAYIVFAHLNIFMFTAFMAQFFVLLQSPNNKISSFEESKIDIGAEDTIYNRAYFTKENELVDESLRLKVYTRKIKGRESSFFLNRTIGMERVRQGYFAFHILNPTAYAYIKRSYNDYERRTLRTFAPIIGHTRLFLCLPKNSAMEDSISVGLLRLRQAGIENMEILRLFPSKPIPDYSSTSLFVCLGLKDVYHLYVAFGSGIMASIIILLLERIHFKVKKHRRCENLILPVLSRDE